MYIILHSLWLRVLFSDWYVWKNFGKDKKGGVAHNLDNDNTKPKWILLKIAPVVKRNTYEHRRNVLNLFYLHRKQLTGSVPLHLVRSTWQDRAMSLILPLRVTERSHRRPAQSVVANCRNCRSGRYRGSVRLRSTRPKRVC